ncbi:type IV secretion system protein [Qipengyuania sp. S6317L1]|uniref:type IV secretion system protein n=1 Tax=Qipengyuania sp. S6317L1 TaxID=2926410 RepID=UPI001FF2909E|nr:type IV secretion system protein [Qipengyuania sp. S6317L1]MCK0099903.1 type IV secretion system protein [Qipengyuania sp. S6317L1]
MTTACDLAAEEMGSGVAGALTAVDCIASEVSEQAFSRLFGSDGQLGIALTVVLTLYIAFFGISLLLGRSNLSVRALLPKMVTVGLVLTFATSFAAFSTIFYNLFVTAPDFLAGVLTASDGSATATFALKLDIVFLAIQEASTGIEDISAFSPPGMMWIGAMLLLIGTVGLLVTARIGLALLLAVGPIFVVLALFNGTRGLFVGWLKGLVMLALAPLFAVVGGSLMLEMAVPILSALVSTPGVIDQQAAMAFFLVGFVHCMLMLMVLYVGSKMVSGWQVFGFATPDVATQPNSDAYHNAPAPVVSPTVNRAAQTMPTAASGVRRTAVVSPSVVAANDTNGSSTTNTVRETKVFATGSGNSQSGPQSAAASRTRGIGNRFRSAPSASARPKPETSK